MKEAVVFFKLGNATNRGNLPVAKVPSQQENPFPLFPCILEMLSPFDTNELLFTLFREKRHFDKFAQRPQVMAVKRLSYRHDLIALHRATKNSIEVFHHHLSSDRDEVIDQLPIPGGTNRVCLGRGNRSRAA